MDALRSLNFTIGALDLKFNQFEDPSPDEIERTVSREAEKTIVSPLKSKSFQIDDPSSPIEYIYSDYKVFLILRDFLQPNSTISLSDAVDRVVDMLPDGWSTLRDINWLCFDLAKQIPYYHPSHLKLARLLWGIGKSEKLDTTAVTDVFYQHLGEDLRDNYGRPGRDDDEPARYFNYQAFLANLIEVGPWQSDSQYALWTIPHAFEESHEKEGLTIQDAYIMGAAQWIFWYGQRLYKICGWRSFKKGQVARKDRHMWKKEFREVAGSDKLGKECITIAIKAAEKMDMLEREMSV